MAHGAATGTSSRVTRPSWATHVSRDLVVEVESSRRRDQQAAGPGRCASTSGSRAAASRLGRLSEADDRDAVRARRSRRARSARSSRPVSAARSTMTEPGRIAAHRGLRDEHRRGSPGIAAVVMTASASADVRRDQLLLALRAAPRRAPSRSRPRSPRPSTSSSRKVAPRLSTCSLTTGSRVEGRDDRAEPARRRDRLQPGHAGAEHQHLRRRDRARGRRQHGNEPAERSAASKHRLVAGDGRLRGERVHRLRAGDARDRRPSRTRSPRARRSAARGRC